MRIQYLVTYIGTIEAPDAATEDEIVEKICLDFSGNEPNDFEWEEVK